MCSLYQTGQDNVKIKKFLFGPGTYCGPPIQTFAETANVIPEGFWYFYRVFKAKHCVAVNSKLVQLLKLNNFCIYTISPFCENFCANLVFMSHQWDPTFSFVFFINKSASQSNQNPEFEKYSGKNSSLQNVPFQTRKHDKTADPIGET